MSRLVDSYTTTELRSGDVLVVTVTLHVTYHLDENNKPYFRMYRCGYPDAPVSEEGVPQGGRIFIDEQKIAETLFPIVSNLGLRSEG